MPGFDTEGGEPWDSPPPPPPPKLSFPPLANPLTH